MPCDAPRSHNQMPELNMRQGRRHIGAAGYLDPGLPLRLEELRAHGKVAAAARFVGLTTYGTHGDVPLASHRRSLAPRIAAGEVFLAALSQAGRETVSLQVGNDARRESCNIHPYLVRHGVGLRELTGRPEELWRM